MSALANLQNKLDLSKPYFSKLINKGGKIYLVGGIIRDAFLNKENKDIDIVIEGLTIENIVLTLQQYGDVDLVGKSFGVLKFKPKGTNEDIDIAMPRKEVKTGEGHKGFEIQTSSKFTILDDLERRDFTINSITYNVKENELIDPYNGIEDIENKVLKCVSEKSFVEDPLRIMRGLQFASRFNLTIEEITESLIKQNINSIKEISKERILIELEKGMKGNKLTFAKLLTKFEVFENLFNLKRINNINWKLFNDCNKLSEFLFLFSKGFNISNIADFLSNNLGITNEAFYEIAALEFISTNPKSRTTMFESLKRTSIVLETRIITDLKFINNQLAFNSGMYPKSLKEVNINGDDLLGLGYKGKEIGATLNVFVFNIMLNLIENEKEQLYQQAKELILILK